MGECVTFPITFMSWQVLFSSVYKLLHKQAWVKPTVVMVQAQWGSGTMANKNKMKSSCHALRCKKSLVVSKQKVLSAVRK